jgi:hypothetical protein
LEYLPSELFHPRKFERRHERDHAVLDSGLVIDFSETVVISRADTERPSVDIERETGADDDTVVERFEFQSIALELIATDGGADAPFEPSRSHDALSAIAGPANTNGRARRNVA